MATPALRLLRDRLRGTFIGGLARPGIDELLAGSDFFDEIHVERARGVMGPKFVAAKIRPRRYDAALLLTNSFSTALTARIAGIPRRFGYARDGRGLLLTDRFEAPRRADGRWAPVPATAYYWHAAGAVLAACGKLEPGDHAQAFDLPRSKMELATTPDQEAAADEVLARAGVDPGRAMIILNPGGNNPAKRWPSDRFAAIGRELAARFGVNVLVNGSPGEADLTTIITSGIDCDLSRPRCAYDLAPCGVTLGSLKSIVRRCRLMITNDTGPRHIAAAFRVPVVSIFGPTDPRWTTIPVDPGMEHVLSADPSLPPEEIADDHPDRCRVDRVSFESVLSAAAAILDPSLSSGQKAS